MTAGGDLAGWATGRETRLGEFLVSWSRAASGTDDVNDDPLSRSDDAPAALVANWLEELLLDDVRTVELDGLHAVHATRSRAAQGPTVLVVGVHDLPRCGGADSETSPPARFDSEGVLGTGVASRFGSFAAHVHAYLALSGRPSGLDVNLQVLSLSEGLLYPDVLADLAGEFDLSRVDGVIATSSVAWDLGAPTISVGARGELVIDVTIDTGRDVATGAFAGAVRNPLTMLIEALGQLREPNGRIALPGFYHRARPASEDERQLLIGGAIDPNAWLRATGTNTHVGGPSALERVSLWPSLEVVALEAGVDQRSTTHTIPGTATATLAFQLVPDQRPVEIEASLRSWLEQRIPAEVGLTIQAVSAAEPCQVDRSSALILAQARALKAVCGAAPTAVAAGGMPGIASLADMLGVPMIFNGLAAPASHVLTGHERLSMQRMQLGVMIAGELFDQLQPKTGGLAARFARLTST